MGKLMEKESKKTSFMHGEISKLMHKGPSKGPLKGQKFSHDRAVAAALNVARKKGYDVGPAPKDENMSVFDKLIQEKELTATARKHVKSGSFVFPKERRYPIHDAAHARNALARVSQFGTSSEKAKVRAAVHRKFPGIGEKDENVESVFDKFVTEGKMPPAFAKFIKKKAEGKKPAKDDDDDSMEETTTLKLLSKPQAESSSFDQFVSGGQAAPQGSAFDGFVKTESVNASVDEKLAKTLALTESLAALKKKVLGS